MQICNPINIPVTPVVDGSCQELSAILFCISKRCILRRFRRKEGLYVGFGQRQTTQMGHDSFFEIKSCFVNPCSSSISWAQKWITPSSVSHSGPLLSVPDPAVFTSANYNILFPKNKKKCLLLTFTWHFSCIWTKMCLKLHALSMTLSHGCCELMAAALSRQDCTETEALQSFRRMKEETQKRRTQKKFQQRAKN